MGRLAFTCAAALAAGCVTPPGSSLCGGGACPSERTVEQVFQQSRNTMLDLLFVVDDTPAIAPFQAMLADGFSSDAAVLQGLSGGVPNLHVGFISSSHGDGSPAARAGDCGLAAPAAIATVDSCGQHTNFTGSLDSTFSCLGDFGVTSSAPAQPLASLRRVLEHPPPGWEGFLRPDAALFIVIIAGADDASPDPVQDTIAFVLGLKPDPANSILISAIVPPVPGDCATDFTPSVPRLTSFVESAGANGLIAPFCNDGPRGALIGIGDTLAILVLPKCLRGVRDVDPATPGVQADCVVEETITRSDGATTTTLLPSCDQAAPPCWWARAPSAVEAGYCSGGVSFGITQAADFCPEWLTRTRVECVGCLDPADPACAGS
jgi:hypothetical protein